MAPSTSKPVGLPVRYFLVLLYLGAVCCESEYGDFGSATARLGRGMDPDAYRDDTDENQLGSGIVRGIISAWDDCVEDNPRSDGANVSVACQGLKLVRSALAQWSRGSFELSSGVEIVAVAPEGGRTSRNLGDAGESAAKGRAGLLARFRHFLENHELRIRLPRLLPEGESWSRYLGTIYHEHATAAMAEGRKKDKGGGMMLAMMGMMGAMAMKMGMGAVAALAMKALAVSGVAMMLALVAALKKLSSKDDGGHHVQVVPVHGGHHDHRRRRDLDGDYAQRLAFAAYRNSR